MTDDPTQLEGLLADYVDGHLGDAEGRELDAYLDAHPDVRAVLRRLMVDSEALRSLPRIGVPVDVSEDYRGQIERDLLLGDAGASARRLDGRWNAPFAAIAAILIVSLGMSGVAYWVLAKRPAPFVDYAITGPSQSAATMPEAFPLDAADVARRERAGAATPPLPGVTAAAPSARAASARWSGANAANRPLAEAMMKDAGVADPPSMLESVPPSVAPSVRADIAAARVAVRPDVSITFAAPKLELPVAPVEVSATLAPRRGATRRGVAYVVEARDAIAADREVRDALVAVADAKGTVEVAPSLGIEGGGLAARPADDARGPAREVGPTLSNTAGPDAIGDALAVASAAHVDEGGVDNGSRDGVHIVRGLSESDVRTLQLKLNSRSRVAGAGIAGVQGYELPPASVEVEPVIGAGTPKPATFPSASPATVPSSDVLRTGDRLRITLIDPDASDLRTQQEVTVDATGRIALPSLDGIAAADGSIEQLRQAIVGGYQRSGLMKRPLVTVEPASAHQTAMQQLSGVGLPGGASSAKPDDRVDVFVIVRGPATRSAAEATRPTTTTPRPATTRAAD